MISLRVMVNEPMLMARCIEEAGREESNMGKDPLFIHLDIYTQVNLQMAKLEVRSGLFNSILQNWINLRIYKNT